MLHLNILSLFFLSASVLSLPSLSVSASVPPSKYVIVGAGTTGLLVANRLSFNPKHHVVVIDPGPDIRSNPNVTNPLIWLQNINSSIDWAYLSSPQVHTNGRMLPYHAGKIIGGTSMINGMTYLRPDAAEIDAWENLGAKGWNWTTLYPYYKRVEQFSVPTTAQAQAGASFNPHFHGKSGEVSTGYLFSLLNGSFHETVASTWSRLGYSKAVDANGGNLNGVDLWPMTVDRDANVRDSAARAFYYPIDRRPNLRIVNGTVTKMIWGPSSAHGQVATGVEYLDAGGKRQSVVLKGSGEVILAVSSLRTPGILEASGIGNRTHLQRLGVPLKIDLPGVGENLQDQPNVPLAYNSTTNRTGYTPYANFATAQQLFGTQFQSIAATTKADLSAWAGAIASDGSSAPAPALERILSVQHDLLFKKKASAAEVLISSAGTRLLAVAIASLPFSRGSVHLRSTDLADVNRPMIDPRFLQIDFDREWTVRAAKFANEFWSAAPAKQLVTGSAAMLPLNASDEQWAAYVAASYNPNYHPIGTAAMMARELGGVVDPRLKVYGTTNVRIVDASVLPLQNSAHLTSTLYAVAERAADIILGKVRDDRT